MRLAPAALLLLLGIPLAHASDARGDPVLAGIDACVAKLDTGLDVGYERVAEHCPELAASLEASRFAPWLPRDWKRAHNQLSALGLTELRAEVVQEEARTAAARGLRPADARAALAALESAARPAEGWWARFKHWLRELLSVREQPEESGWLQRLIERAGLSRALTDWIAWLALAAIAVLAAVILINELRVAGVLAPRGRRTRALPASAAGGTAAPTLAELEHASLPQRPRLLLEMIAARLGETGRLPPAQALTVRELARCARLAEAADRQRLAELAATCERVRYAGGEVALPVIHSALARGRELLASLEGAPLQVQGA